MAFTILTLSIMTFNKLKISKNDIQQNDIKYNDTQNNVAFVLVFKRMLRVSFFAVKLIVIMPNVIMANVVAPEDALRERDEGIHGKHAFVSNQAFFKEI
jgi:hypothetical protein